MRALVTAEAAIDSDGLPDGLLASNRVLLFALFVRDKWGLLMPDKGFEFFGGESNSGTGCVPGWIR